MSTIATYAAPSTIGAFVSALRAGRRAAAMAAYREGAAIEIDGLDVRPSLRTCKTAITMMEQGLGDCVIVVDHGDVEIARRIREREQVVLDYPERFAPERGTGTCYCGKHGAGETRFAPDADLQPTPILFVGDCCATLADDVKEAPCA